MDTPRGGEEGPFFPPRLSASLSTRGWGCGGELGMGALTPDPLAQG